VCGDLRGESLEIWANFQARGATRASRLRRGSRGDPGKTRSRSGCTFDLSRRRAAAFRRAARLVRVVAMRYRFFLYAGLMPHCRRGVGVRDAGARYRDVLDGLGGVVLAVIGVEAFNDYFDARLRTDRVFDPEGGRPSPTRVLERRRVRARSAWGST
jgi:hypothetical protein